MKPDTVLSFQEAQAARDAGRSRLLLALRVRQNDLARASQRPAACVTRQVSPTASIGGPIWIEGYGRYEGERCIASLVGVAESAAQILLNRSYTRWCSLNNGMPIGTGNALASGWRIAPDELPAIRKLPRTHEFMFGKYMYVADRPMVVGEMRIEQLTPGVQLFRVARENEFHDHDNHDRPFDLPLGPPTVEVCTVLCVVSTRRGCWRVECRPKDTRSEVHYQFHRFDDLGLRLTEVDAWAVFRSRGGL